MTERARVSLSIASELKGRLDLMSGSTLLPINSLAIIALESLVSTFEQSPNHIFGSVGQNIIIHPRIQMTYDEAIDKLVQEGETAAAEWLRRYMAEDSSKRGWDSAVRSPDGEFAQRFPEAHKNPFLKTNGCP